MALILAEGFENTSPEGINNKIFSLGPVSAQVFANLSDTNFVTGRNGGTAAATMGMYVSFSPTVTHMFVSLAVRLASNSGTDVVRFLGVTDPLGFTSSMALLVIEASTGNLVFKRGGSTALVTVSGYIVRDGVTWNWICAEYLPDNTNGYIALYDGNGNLLGSYSGDTMDSETSGEVSYIYVGSGALNVLFDDIIINDDQPSGSQGNPYFTTKVPDTTVTSIVPNGPGDLSEFSPNGAATIWESIDDSPTVNGDTDYASTTGPDSRYLVKFNPTDLTQIRGVIVTTQCKRDDAGLWKTRHLIRPSPSSPVPYYESPQFWVSNSNVYVSYASLWLTNPENDTAWNKNDINQLQAGLRAVAV